MSPELFAEVSELFLAVRTLSDAERESVISERCSNRPDLKEALEQLLAADGHRNDGFDDSAMLEGLNLDAFQGLSGMSDSSTQANHDGEPGLPERIGRFRIIRKLGEGGMGVVCEAEQDNPRRLVALKLLRTGISSAGLARRFVLEAQILARLQHPGIARVYEAGTAATPNGVQPYFAMELISGRPLQEHVESLNISERLDLFILVCDAVEYAHQKGVIHRDLKPANILVDEHGSPRILDFGVARATRTDWQGTTLHTAPGQLVGTLPYMSPEQVGGDLAAIDSRTDVYALGVVLFQLLTGRLPIDTRSKTIADAARVIRDQEPTQLGTLDTAFRGDLEIIAARALEKDPSRRYQTVAAMALDIRRHLSHEPIVARPPTRLYQFKKFARRNPQLLTAMSLIVLVLIVGITATSYSLYQSTRSRREAERMSAIVMSTLGPTETLNSKRAELVSQVIKDEIRKSGAPTHPSEQIALFQAIAQRYGDIELIEQSTRFWAQAYQVSVAFNGPNSETTLDLKGRLAAAMCRGAPQVETLEEAAFLAEQAYKSAVVALGSEHALTLRLEGTMGYTMVKKGDYSGVAMLRSRLSKLQADPKSDPLEVAGALENLAWPLHRHGEFWEAEPLLRDALAIRERPGLPRDEYRRLNCQHSLALSLSNQGRFVEAVELFTRTLNEATSIIGTDPDRRLIRTLVVNRSLPLFNLRRFDEAAADMKSWADYWRRPDRDRTAATDAELLGALNDLGAGLAWAGKTEECARAFEECLALAKQRGSPRTREFQTYASLYTGLGIGAPWGCEVLRGAAAWHGYSAMIKRDQEFVDQVDWTKLAFRAVRWDGAALQPGWSLSEDAGWKGGLAELQRLTLSEPGAYFLFIEAPAGNGQTICLSPWIFIAPWQARMYEVPFDATIESSRWQKLTAMEPGEAQTFQGFHFCDWFSTGWGPGGRHQHFGMVATTSLDLPPGDFELFGGVDDGVRIDVDGEERSSLWRRGTVYNFPPVKIEGNRNHNFRVQYHQGYGGYVFIMSLRPVGDAAEAFEKAITEFVKRDRAASR